MRDHLNLVLKISCGIFDNFELKYSKIILKIIYKTIIRAEDDFFE